MNGMTEIEENMCKLFFKSDSMCSCMICNIRLSQKKCSEMQSIQF